MKENLHWHFPDLQHADSEGINDPLLQYFKGDFNKYIARELIQNSIDARLDDKKPVVVHFERITLPSKKVPGIEELRGRLEACSNQAKAEDNEKAVKMYAEALKTANQDKIVILRASDFNTKGLDGEDKDKKGTFHRLVKAVGENQVSGAGGGSYGIGKGAPFVASLLRTVYYSTLNGSGELIFQGKSRLMSHVFNDVEYRAVGSFGVEGYKSVRTPHQIPSDFIRTERGTDINILGYDINLVWVDELAGSVLANFWKAVHSGILEVIIIDGLKRIEINTESLRRNLEKYSKDTLVYYRTVVEKSEYFSKQLPILGTCHLYVRLEDKFPKKLVVMRSPQMTVDEWNFPKTLQEPYAAVFVCDDTEGNLILRALEPPEHDKWDAALDKERGSEILREIREWVKGNLLSLAGHDENDPEEIPDLQRFLPYDEDVEKESLSKIKMYPTGTATKDESGMEVGAEREEEENIIEGFVRRPVMKKAAVGDGFGSKKRLNGGDGEGGVGKNPGTGGIMRIDTSLIRSRIIYNEEVLGGASEYCLILEPLSNQEGFISVVAQGSDGAVYPISLAYAEDWDKNEHQSPYKLSGSNIEGMHLKKGERLRIRIGVKSGSRYALGIENYES